MWVYPASLAAALLFAAGSVVQQRAAAEAPPEKTLSLALLWWLVRRRLWLAGLGLSVPGNLIAAMALGAGGVTLVQPLLTVRLLFALPLAAAWSRLKVPRRDWAGAIACAAGLAAFVLVGHPHKGHPLSAGWLSWLEALVAIGVVVAGLVALARRVDAVRAAPLLGAAAGALFGLQSSLTEVSLDYWHRLGVAGLFLHWQPYVLIAAAVYGAVLLQSAYEMAPLPASFPALVTAEPLTGLGVGVMVLHGTLHVTAPLLAGELAGLGVMIAGVWLLASSPLVTGQLHALQRRREEGIAYRTADRLERLLTETEGQLAANCRGGQPAEHLAHQVQHLERQLGSLDELLAEMAHQRDAEVRDLKELPVRSRLTLAPLEQELDARQEQLRGWSRRLQGELRDIRRQLGGAAGSPEGTGSGAGSGSGGGAESGAEASGELRPRGWTGAEGGSQR